MEFLKVPQWINWFKEPLPDNPDKMDKRPCNPDNGAIACNHLDPKNWHDYKYCFEQWQNRPHAYEGVGFVLTDKDPYCCIDIDNVFNKESIPNEIKDIINSFDTFKEYSQSGNGLHIWFKAKKPEKYYNDNDKSCRPGNLCELYDRGRFICVTGKKVTGVKGLNDSANEINNCQKELEALLEKYVKITDKPKTVSVPKIYESNNFTIDEIITKACESENGDKFKRLWEGDTSDYSNDHSRADQAFCNLLAFWFDCDVSKIDNVFRQSGLMRKKWERDDYRNDTINKAIQSCQTTYSEGLKSNNSLTGYTIEYDPHWKEKLNPESNTDYFTWKIPGVIESFESTHLAKYCLEKNPNFKKDNVIFYDNSWFVWNGKQWEEQQHGDYDIERRIIDSYEFLKQDIIHLNISDKEKKALIKEAVKMLDSGKISKINKSLQTCCANQKIYFDDDPDIINCQSGIVNLRTGELMPHDKTKYCSKITQTGYDLTEPVVFTEFLRNCVKGDMQLFNYIRKVIGYSFTGRTTEQCAYFFVGSGRTGKSTLLTTITNILGSYGANKGPEIITENNRFDLYHLRGKRINNTAELNKKKELETDRFKIITAGERRDCEIKNGPYANIRFDCKLLISTNDMPKFDADYAIKRRLRFIPFDNKVLNPDPWLLDKLWEERDQIFAWGVQGSMDYYISGVGELSSMIKQKEEAIIESNELYIWFEENYAITNDDSDFVSNKELWAPYNNYCSVNNISPLYKGSQTFQSAIRKQFDLQATKRQGNRGTIGIKKIPIY